MNRLRPQEAKDFVFVLVLPDMNGRPFVYILVKCGSGRIYVCHTKGGGLKIAD